MLEINLRYVANLQYVSQQATACVSLYFMNKRAPFPPQSWTELEATGNKYPRTRSFILPDYSWQKNTHLPPTPEQRYHSVTGSGTFSVSHGLPALELRRRCGLK